MKTKVLLAVVLFCLPVLGRAESDLPQGASETRQQAVLPDWFFSDLFSNYHGSSLRQLDSSRAMTVDGHAGPTGSSNFDSEAGVGYKLSDTLRLGAIVPFQLYPTTPTNEFSLGDVGVKLSQLDTVNWNNLHVATAVAIQAATNNYSRNRGMKFSARIDPNVKYFVPDSDFTLGAWDEIKTYPGSFSGHTFKIWTLPYVAYRLNKTFSVSLGYELDMRHFAKTSNYLSNYEHDLQPTVTWKVSRTVYVSPYLEMFDLGRINTNTVGFGTVITAATL
jgi:hypothetical protein